MMARLRYRAMYLTSCAIGYTLAGALLLCGQRFRSPVAELVRGQARRHAVDAARKRGPYLAPITFVASLTVIETLIAWLVWRSL